MDLWGWPELGTVFRGWWWWCGGGGGGGGWRVGVGCVVELVFVIVLFRFVRCVAGCENGCTVAPLLQIE